MPNYGKDDLFIPFIGKKVNVQSHALENERTGQLKYRKPNPTTNVPSDLIVVYLKEPEGWWRDLTVDMRGPKAGQIELLESVEGMTDTKKWVLPEGTELNLLFPGEEGEMVIPQKFFKAVPSVGGGKGRRSKKKVRKSRRRTRRRTRRRIRRRKRRRTRRRTRRRITLI